MRVRQFTASAAGKALPAVVACLLIGAGTAGASVLAADEPADPVVEQPADPPPTDVPPTEQPPAEVPPVEPPAVPPAPDADDDAAEAPEAAPGAAVTAPPCPADVRNHGAYVSSVARDPANAGPQHGAIVAAAAQSDCGKKPGDAADTDADETTPTTPRSPRPARPRRPRRPSSGRPRRPPRASRSRVRPGQLGQTLSRARLRTQSSASRRLRSALRRDVQSRIRCG